MTQGDRLELLERGKQIVRSHLEKGLLSETNNRRKILWNKITGSVRYGMLIDLVITELMH